MQRKAVILLVDDQPYSIQALAVLLKEDYAILVAKNGAKALEIAAGEHKPDLILLDVNMPGMDGYEVCKQLKSNSQTADIPVFFITGRNETEDEEHGFAIGAEDYITKPFKPIVVRARVKNALNRKLSQEMSQISELRYKTILSSTSDLIFVVDENDCFIDAHFQADNILMLPPEMFIGKKITEVMPDYINKLYNINSNQVRNNGKSREFEYTMQVQAQIKWFNALLDLHTANRQHIIVCIRDITERKLAELALRESEEKHRLIVENSYDIIYTLDYNGIFIFVSPAWTILLGHSIVQVQGQPIEKFVHPEDLPTCISFLQKITQSEHGGHGVEYRIQHLDGSWKWHTSSGNMLKNADGTTTYLGVAKDITASKQIEQALKESNATKDKFFRIIAHDLKSPFNAILGFSTMLKDELDNLEPAEILDFVDAIHSSSRNAYKLLENLLDWSMSQTGKITFKPININLENIFTDIIKSTGSVAKTKFIQLEYSIIDDIVVIADKNMLFTILRNLVTNAIKFTPKKGKITLNAQITSDTEVEISIIDNGVGMTAETMAKLFRIDETIKLPGTENEQGTGLGLLLCKEFVEKHGGKIWVESQIAQGSKFKFTLPYQQIP
jgi:two-component system, sensor histidine kinase and response regulator